MIDYRPRNNHPIGCETHYASDCGCPGYPSISSALRDCGNHCDQVPYIDRCIRCQAARLIDTLTTRSERYLDRIVDLQDELETVTPPAGYIHIELPIGLVEQIVDTNRILFAIEPIRTAILNAYNGHDTPQP